MKKRKKDHFKLILLCTIILTVSFTGCIDMAGDIMSPYGRGHMELDTDLFVLKLDDHGDKQWLTVIDNGSIDWPMAMVENNNGEYIIAGEYENELETNHSIPSIIALDDEGAVISEKYYEMYPGDTTTSIALSKNNGYYVSIHSGSIICLDKLLNEIWTTNFSAERQWWSVITTNDGGCAVAGGSWIYRLDETGKITGEKSVGEKNEISRSFIQTTDGNYLLGYSHNVNNNDNRELTAILFDSHGKEIWQTEPRIIPNEYFYLIEETAPNDYSIISGRSWLEEGRTINDCIVTSLDSNGNVIEKMNLNACRPIVTTSDGGYLFTGFQVQGKDKFDSYAYPNDKLHVVKLDDEGNVQWNKDYELGYMLSITSILQTSDGGYIVLGRNDKF